MENGAREGEGFDFVLNGVNRFFAELEISAIASAGFLKEGYPHDTVQIRARTEQKLRTVPGVRSR